MKKAKTIRRFNVFDVIVILLVIVLIASFVYRIYVGVDKIPGQSSRAKYAISFECDAEYNSLLEYIQAGDAVYFDHDGTLLGYLYARDDNEGGAVYEITGTTPDTVESAEDVEADDTVVEYEKIKIGGSIKLNVDTVKAKNGNHYVIGDTNISNGSVIKVYTEKATFTITVKDVYILE